jgi:cell shape-determining protein MreD
MVGSTLGVYIFGLIFVSARTNKRHHHHRIDKQVSTCQLILTTWVLLEYKVSVNIKVCVVFRVSGFWFSQQVGVNLQVPGDSDNGYPINRIRSHNGMILSLTD